MPDTASCSKALHSLLGRHSSVQRTWFPQLCVAVMFHRDEIGICASVSTLVPTSPELSVGRVTEWGCAVLIAQHLL